MLRKIVFLEQFFGIAFLYIDQQQAKSLGVLRAGCKHCKHYSSGDLHGTYVKQTIGFQSYSVCDKDKGKVLEACLGVYVSWTKITEVEESPQVCLSYLNVPIR